MPLVLRSSLEHRIISHASGHYPRTAGELARVLGVKTELVMAELRRMESRGLVELDILPDKVFVRLLVVPEKAAPGGKERKKEGNGGEDPAYL